MAEIGNYGYLLPFRNLLPYLVVDISESSLSRSSYAGIVKSAVHLTEILFGYVYLKIFHFKIGISDAALALKLLTHLLKLQFSGVELQFSLLHLIACARPETVEIAFIAEFDLHAVHRHLLYFHLHREILDFCVIIHLLLVEFISLHLNLILELVKFRLGALQVKPQQRSAHIHAVTGFAIHLNHACADRRSYNLFKSRHHFSRTGD